MNRRNETALLRALPELAGLEEREVASLLPHFDEVRVAPGATLAHAGRPATAYLVVLAGSLEAKGAHGPGRIHAGQSVGWDAMWNRGCSATTVTTAEPSRLLVMGRAQFRAVRALRSRIEEGPRPRTVSRRGPR